MNQITNLQGEVGNNLLRIYAEDIYGNIGSDNVIFTISTLEQEIIPPTVTITHIASGGLFANANFTVLASHLDSCYYILNGGTNTPIPCSVGMNQITNLQGEVGNNILRIYANDTYGNIGYDAVFFTISTLEQEIIPPIVTITHVASGGLFANVNFTVIASHLDSCYYTLNGVPNNPTPCSVGMNQITNLQGEVGNNLLIIYANDTYGNIGSDNVVFTISTLAEGIPPIITAIEPQNNEILDHTDVILKVSTDEAANVTYSLNGGTNVTMNETSSLVFESAQLNLENEKTHTVTYYATDLFGNTASLTITFSIDKNKDSSYSSDSGYSTEDIDQDLSKEPTIDLDNQNPKLNWWQRFVNWLCRLFGLEEVY